MADLILVGGGLANTLIALRLAESQPELKVCILEAGPALGGNHTWSFHGSDITPAQLGWLEPFIVANWEGYDVRFPKLQRTLPGSYHSISSDRFAQVASARLGNRVRTGVRVARLEPTRVVLDDGSELNAQACIDGRGPVESEHLDVGFQKFVGQRVKLRQPHGMTRPVIMDATMQQDDGYRFFYTLPFSADTVLIEDTRYSDSPRVEPETYRHEIARYAEAHGWEIAEVLEEEQGVLPITLDGDIKAFWDSDADRMPRSGLRAALFHPGTGYSLPNALQLADRLATHTDWSADAVYAATRAASTELWEATGYYRRLNRLLFLAAQPHERFKVLARFYGLNAGLISRFYAGTNNRFDKIRILVGKPPVGVGPAISTLLLHRGR